MVKKRSGGHTGETANVHLARWLGRQPATRRLRAISLFSRLSDMTTVFDTWLTEPRVPNPPRRVWRDWTIVGATVVGSLLEALLRTDLHGPYAAAPVAILLSLALLWRRSQPFAVFVAVVGGVALCDVLFALLGYGNLNTYGGVLVLVALYALFRWGSGREMAMGIPLAVALAILANSLAYTGLADFIGGFVILALAVAIALVVRYRNRVLEQSREQVRVQERERLARELHDTVAHHVSAIAIQAQAGRFVAQNGSLDGATEALEVIEEEASRTLSQMRTIVGALRERDPPVDMAPQHGIADIEALTGVVGSLRVTVEVDESARGAAGGVGAAAFRIAQESITNARRHARNATSVHVRVASDGDAVHLTITDNGDLTNATDQGFGLIGMTARATLLGGSLNAGPASDRGWVVQATLPRQTDA